MQGERFEPTPEQRRTVGAMAGFPRAMALGMRWICAAHDATLLQVAATERAGRMAALKVTPPAGRSEAPPPA